MNRVRTLVFLAAVSLGRASHAQTNPVGTVVVNHSDKSAARSGAAVFRGKEPLAFNVPVGKPIEITVSHSNSALYTCSISTKPIPIGETDSLHSWLKELKNYAPLVLGAILPGLGFEA